MAATSLCDEDIAINSIIRQHIYRLANCHEDGHINIQFGSSEWKLHNNNNNNNGVSNKESCISLLSKDVMIELLQEFMFLSDNGLMASDIKQTDVFKQSNLESLMEQEETQSTFDTLESITDRLTLRVILTRQLTLYNNFNANTNWMQEGKLCKNQPDDESSYCLSSNELRNQIHSMCVYDKTMVDNLERSCFHYVPEILALTLKKTKIDGYVLTLTKEELVEIAFHLAYVYDVYTPYILENWDMTTNGRASSKELIYKEILSVNDLIEIHNTMFPGTKINTKVKSPLSARDIQNLISEKAHSAKMNDNDNAINNPSSSKQTTMNYVYASSDITFTEEQMKMVEEYRKKIIRSSLEELRDSCLHYFVETSIRKVKDFYKTDSTLSKFQFYTIHNLTDEDKIKICRDVIDNDMTRSQLAIMWYYLDKHNYEKELRLIWNKQ